MGLVLVSWFLGLVIPVLVLNWAAGARFGAAAGIIVVLVTAAWSNIPGAILMNIAAWFVVRGQAFRLGIDKPRRRLHGRGHQQRGDGSSSYPNWK